MLGTACSSFYPQGYGESATRPGPDLSAGPPTGSPHDFTVTGVFVDLRVMPTVEDDGSIQLQFAKGGNGLWTRAFAVASKAGDRGNAADTAEQSSFWPVSGPPAEIGSAEIEDCSVPNGGTAVFALVPLKTVNGKNQTDPDRRFLVLITAHRLDAADR